MRQNDMLRMLAGMILEQGRSEKDLPEVVEFPAEEPERLRWRQWLGAAAVLSIGLFAGFLLNGKRTNQAELKSATANTSLNLIDIDFEQAEPGAMAGIPKTAGRWSGDPMELVTKGSSDVPPCIGDSMACLTLPADNAPAPAPFGSEPKRAVQWRIVDLPDAGPTQKSRVAELCVQFNRDAEVPDPDLICRIELYSFRGPLGTAASQLESEDYLAAAIAHFQTDSDPKTWETAKSKLSIAPEAEFLLLGISGFAQRIPQPSGGEKFSGHYADGVELKLISSNNN